jgi:hypothetical protein
MLETYARPSPIPTWEGSNHAQLATGVQRLHHWLCLLIETLQPWNRTLRDGKKSVQTRQMMLRLGR